MTRNKNKEPDLQADESEFGALDFDPATNLANALSGRTLTEGITIDSRRTEIIDDGFWRYRNRDEGGWHIRTSIADVPAIIPDDSQFAKRVVKKFSNDDLVLSQKQGRDQIRNFPFNLLKDFVSLQQGAVRPVFSFDIDLDHDFHMTDYKIVRDSFKNLHKCDHTGLANQYQPIKDQVKGWYKMSRTMMANRVFDMVAACDDQLGYGAADRPNVPPQLDFNPENQSEVLVQEMMRLTNAVAGDFVVAHNLTVPILPPSKNISIEYVSSNPAFDAQCDALAASVIEKYSKTCPPKVRVSSPMRLYSDYVTMKIMARQLEGLPESPALKKEAQRLTAIFEKAAHKPCSAKHMAEVCSRKLAHQDIGHPFSYLTNHKNDAASVRADKIGRPDVVIRTLQISGGEVILVGLQMPQDGKTSWAISHDYDSARERAACRMLRSLGQLPPAYGPQAKP